MGLEKIGLEGVFKTEAFSSGLKTYTGGLTSAISKTTSVAGAIGSVLGGAVTVGVTALAALGTAAIAAGGIVVGAITKIVFSAATLGDSLSQMSAVTGLSTTRLQELSYAGKFLDVDLETITSGLRFLTRNMYAAREGTGAQAEAFAALGIQVVDASGNLRDADVVFGETIDALGKMKNPTEADAIAMALMGRSAMELNPLIKAGSKALAKFSAEAHRMGAVISEEDIEALDKFKDQTEALKIAFTAIKAKIASAFLPIFQKVLELFRNKLGDPKTQAWITKLTKKLGELTTKLLKTLLPALTNVWNWIKKNVLPILSKLWGWLKNAIPSAINFVVGAWNIFLGVIKTVWDWINANLIPILQKVYTWLAEKIPIAIGILKGAWDTIKNIWDIYISPAWETIRQWLAEKIPIAIGVLKGKWDEIKNIWDVYISPSFTTLYNWLMTNIPKAINWSKTKWGELNTKVAELRIPEKFAAWMTDVGTTLGPKFVEWIDAAKLSVTNFRLEFDLWKAGGGWTHLADLFNAIGTADVAHLQLLSTELRLLLSLFGIGKGFGIGGEAWSFQGWGEAFNKVLDGITWFVERCTDAINWMIDALNRIPSLQGITPTFPSTMTPPTTTPTVRSPNPNPPATIPVITPPSIPVPGHWYKEHFVPVAASAANKNVTNYVTINNPTAEPASTSVDHALRRLSYLGAT